MNSNLSFIEDFRSVTKALFLNLMRRGHNLQVLNPLFKAAMHRVLNPVAIAAEDPNETIPLIFKMTFDPCGFTKDQLRRMLEEKELVRLYGAMLGFEKITFCFLKPKTIGNILCPTKRISPLKIEADEL